MSRFIESIRFCNGKADNLALHQERVNVTFARHFVGSEVLSLEEIIAQHPHNESGLFKLRLVYNSELLELEYQPYQHPQFRHYALYEIPDQFSYEYKSADRALFDKIGKLFPSSVLPLLVQKGCVTDSTFTNLIFSKNGEWYTPAGPLLFGTRLKNLLNAGRVKLREIRSDEIENYDYIIPVNAINRPGEAGEISTKNLFQLT